MELIVAFINWASRVESADRGRKWLLVAPGRFRVLAWTAVFVLAFASAVSAQQYQADKVDDKLSKQGATVVGFVKDPAKYAANQQQFDDFFKSYYFPAMTQFGPDDLAKLGKSRSDLFGLYLWAAQNEDLQKNLTTIALDSMKNIAAKPAYHPAVRYNAVLIIGMLDDKYGIVAAGNQRPPKPSKDANSFLIKLLGAGLAGKPAVTPSLMVGALIGLERHAQYHDGLDAASIEGMTTVAKTLATTDPPVPDVDGKVAEWIRIEAATVLAKLGSVGQNNQVHDALVKVLADSNLTLDGRAEVAGLLGLVNYKDAKVDGKTAVEKLLQLAVEVGQTEDKRAKEFQDQSVAGGGAMSMSRGGRGGRGEYGGYGSSAEAHSGYDRKALLSRLGDLRKGLVAIKPVAPADRAPGVDVVMSAMQGVIDAAANKDTTDLDVAEKVRKMFESIQTAAKGGTATAAAKPAAEAF
jgi:hypothetical protein